MEMIQTYPESPRPPRTVTALLNAVRTGEPNAFNRLMTRVYDELRRMAQQQLRHERPAHTLNPTALVNEFYLKLVQRDQFHADKRCAIRKSHPASDPNDANADLISVCFLCHKVVYYYYPVLQGISLRTV